ncbi:hypothetical protein [Hyphomicrobium sp. MC1]|uniref:hypothetical protein n=1 Tax=Hyphomicrobium sp. (strain MC1) TaxID=717785 RepID=UPI000213EAD3|nr:hypothetical protein [Hyphomicrobium sp. MC1]CCB64074.1 conserved protein of unknown function [Hyphomicrobium sp. MC1]
MRARRIVQTGAFDPEDVERLQTALEAAWLQVEESVSQREREAAREHLATVVVSAGNVSDLDAEELATVAVRTFLSIRASTQSPP